MPLDLRSIQSGLVRVTKDLIGASLSTTGNPPNVEPSVIKARTGRSGFVPEFPYAVVDVITVADASPNQKRLEYFDNNTDEVVILKSKFITMTVELHGEPSDDVYTLAQTFQDSLDFEINLVKVNTEMGVELFENSSLSFFPGLLQTEWEEVARVTLVFTATQEIRDGGGTGYFDTIDIDTNDDDGGLYRTPDDPAPIEIDITVP